MQWRCVVFVLFVLAGCESLRPLPPVVAVKPSDPRVVSDSVAMMVALASELPDEAEAPETLDAVDSLSLTAECLARGDAPTACMHLEAYVKTHPDQPLFRVQLAELQIKNGKLESARLNLERFVVESHNAGPRLRPQRIQAHTQLMELASHEGDSFAVALHRGLGLLVIVEQQDADPKHDAAFREQILCKALRSLREATMLRPDDARARLFLAKAFARIGNEHAARVEEQAARRVNQPGALAPSEQRMLAGPHTW